VTIFLSLLPEISCYVAIDDGLHYRNTLAENLFNIYLFWVVIYYFSTAKSLTLTRPPPKSTEADSSITYPGCFAVNHVIGPDLQAMILPVVLAILIVTLTAVLAKLFLGRQSRGRRILLLGLSDSGKTLMFSRLHSGANIMSQTSMKENRGSFTLDDEKKKVFGELVDVPGHDRLRSQILEKNKQGVRYDLLYSRSHPYSLHDCKQCLFCVSGIILVVDSVSFPQESRDVAELVYDTLADSTFTSHRVPLLLACNKQGMALQFICNTLV
jgi:signal recognition particle receptor subunit beta